MKDAAIRELFAQGGTKLGLDFSSFQIEQFVTYLSELVLWNKKINLTGIKEPREIIIKNFLDSLTPLPYLKQTPQSSWIDIGTGAGFPGLALKIANPTLHFTLVEPVQKKTAFLHHITGLLDLQNVTVINELIENMTNYPQQKADLLLTRALSVKIVLSQAKDLLRSEGQILFYQSRYENKLWDQLILEYSGLKIDQIIPVKLPFSQDPRVLILLRKA